MKSAKETYGNWVRHTHLSAQGGVTDHYFELAGIQLCIRLHGDHLNHLFLSAIAHLTIKPCKADYLIDVWDCRGRDLSFPVFDHGIQDVKLRGEVPLYSGAGINFAYYAHARMVHTLSEGDRHGIVALVDSNQLPKFELACPFRGIFSWILRNNQMAMIHSAALADTHGDGYLIMGKGGAGKSTTAISCLLAGMKYIGDDLCAISNNDGTVRVHSIYSSGKTQQSEWQHLPELRELAEPYHDDDFEKEVYFFGKNQGNTCNSAPLKEIYVPIKPGQSMDAKTLAIASLISCTVDSTRSLIPDGGFESLPLLYAAFKQARVSTLSLRHDRQCPISAA